MKQVPVVVAKRMAAISPKGGKADQALGRALWARGLRYRRRSRLVGRPDLVFPGSRVLVFVDGDFWHGRYLDERVTRGDFKTNADYWIPKLRRNAERDREVTQVLTESGWRVLRVWESDVQKDLEGTANRVASLVEESRGGSARTTRRGSA